MDLARVRSFNTPCKCLVTAAAAMSHGAALVTIYARCNPPTIRKPDWCGASNQRLEGGVLPCAGSGNGDAPGAGAAAVPFGFFGFKTFFRAALGGGPAG